MKKNVIFINILLIILGVLLGGSLIATIYYILIRELGFSAVFATLATLFLSGLIGIYTQKKNIQNSSVCIEPILNDEHFVGRQNEYNKLVKLLIQDKESIIFVSGKIGIGKTHLFKMICDDINFENKVNWKKCTAFYYKHSKKQCIKNGIAETFCKDRTASISDISIALKAKAKKGNSILFIDNINDIEIFEVDEFARAFINCNNGNNHVIIAIDSNNEEVHIIPGKFGIHEISQLIKSYQIDKNDIDEKHLVTLSGGFPIYARYILETHKKNLNILDYNDIDRYINYLIDSFSELEQECLSLIICLEYALQDAIPINTILRINGSITRNVIKKLDTYILINIDEDKIYIDSLIANKCSAFVSLYDDSNYKKIYEFYKNIDHCEHIVLASALKSNLVFSFNTISDIIVEQYENSNFHLLVEMGELEISKTINPHIRENKECLTKLRYFYLKSLLELGLYDRAKRAIFAYDFEYSEISINTIKTEFDFEYQYLLVDLEHLTNNFSEAAEFSHVLCNYVSNAHQYAKCKYLYAHCIRHMGKDLDASFNVFCDLSEDTTYNDDRIRLRSLYSAASIKLFQGDRDYNYDKTFNIIDNIILQNSQNDVWMPYVDRHKAIYEYKFMKKPEKAYDILSKTMQLLEVTSLRIKYDIYFELGEINRLFGKTLDEYETSLSNYNEALRFSKQVNDYNLQSNCEMGIILLNSKFQKDIVHNSILEILEECKRKELNINYNSALYIKHLLNKENISQELMKYWSIMQYSDLCAIACKDSVQKYDLKLTVM